MKISKTHHVRQKGRGRGRVRKNPKKTKYVPRYYVYSRASLQAGWTLQDKLMTKKDAIYVKDSLKRQKPEWVVKIVRSK